MGSTHSRLSSLAAAFCCCPGLRKGKRKSSAIRSMMWRFTIMAMFVEASVSSVKVVASLCQHASGERQLYFCLNTSREYSRL